MKKILIATVLLFTTGAMAAHGPAGCGLGTVLFEDKEGVVFNVLAATFNGSSGNQTFAMSTGTLGCEDAKTAKVGAVSFVENNLMALSNDISKGNGQTLDAYLTLINASATNRSELQKNFAVIFEDFTAQNVHNKIINIVNI